MSLSDEVPACCRVAVIGDIHGSWDDVDVDYFNHSEYDLLLFVGDLGGGTLHSDLYVARSIARLALPALVLPGNNDSVHYAQLAAEFVHQQGLIKLFSIGQQRRSRSLAKALGDVQMVGYSLHPVALGPVAFDVIACRPHPMGGPDISFVPYLAGKFGISTLEQSARRLESLVDEAKSDRLLFFAHNGPTGLGDRAVDIWGCDFRAGAGDWGDPDLAVAIDYAVAKGKRVLAVVAGHMHLRTRSGEERSWRVEKHGLPHINAARVPRIFPCDGATLRHHVALEITGDGIAIEEVFIES